MKGKAPSDGRTQEEDLEDQRKKLHLLEGDRKAFFHTSVLAKQRNRDQIVQLQEENKELREQFKSRALTSGGGSNEPGVDEALIRKTEK